MLAQPQASSSNAPFNDHDTVHGRQSVILEEAHSSRQSGSHDLEDTVIVHENQLPWYRQRIFAELRKVYDANFTPVKPVSPPPSVWRACKYIIFGSYINVLLICIPISWVAHFVIKQDAVGFVFSLVAFIPLENLLAIGTNEILIRVGEAVAALTAATFANALVLIVTIIAVIKCQLEFAQAAAIGFIVNNLLMILGMCLFEGGLRRATSTPGSTTTQVDISFLAISVFAVLLPAAFANAVQAGSDTESTRQDVLNMSHGVAIILQLAYSSYLNYRIIAHTQSFSTLQSPSMSGRPVLDSTGKEVVVVPEDYDFSNMMRFRGPKTYDRGNIAEKTDPKVLDAVQLENGMKGREEMAPILPVEGEVEQPQMSFLFCVGLITIVIALMTLTAEYFVASLNGVTSGKMSKRFVGMILVPLVGNSARHVTTRQKLQTSVQTVIGSSIQIALLVIPLLVTLAWPIGKPLSMLFDPFESATLFLTVLIVNYVVADGKTNWLEGSVLMFLYVIIAVSFWFYNPVSSLTSGLLLCV